MTTLQLSRLLRYSSVTLRGGLCNNEKRYRMGSAHQIVQAGGCGDRWRFCQAAFSAVSLISLGDSVTRGRAVRQVCVSLVVGLRSVSTH